MTPEQIAAIERLRELDRRVGYWQWGQDEQFSHHVLYDDGFCFSVCETDSADALPTHAEFIVTLRNEALPLIEALQQSLSEAQADARVFSGSYNALAEDFGRLKEENERLRDLLKDACADLGRMTLLRDKFYCEMETAQTETVFAKKEIERLRAGITVAAFAESGAKNADSVREMIGAVNSIEKSLKEAQAERDALQARIDGALMPLKSVAGVARHWAKYSGSADKSDLGCVVVKAIEILTGEGE